MDKLIEYIKKHYLLICIIVYLLITISIPFFVNYFYSIPAPINLFESKTGANATLSFIGSVITAFSTILFAIATFIITRKDSAKNMDRPCFAIESVDNGKFDKIWYEIYINNKYTYVTLKNVGEGTAINIYIENNNKCNKNKKSSDKLINIYDSKIQKRNNNYVECNDTLVFKVDLDDLDKTFEIVYINTQGCIYKQVIQYWKKGSYGYIALDIKQTNMGVLGIDY